MLKKELEKASKKLNWDLHQQVLILERFATYKNLTRELNQILLDKAEDEGFTVFNEDNTDVFDIASEAQWSAEELIDLILSFLEENAEKESFKKYVNICFHNK
jgi:hypothetical protein